MAIDLVWFKRDLRVHDHRPLNDAVASGRPVLCLYVIEPDLWAQPQYSARQYAFLHECLIDLDRSLAKRGGHLTVKVGDVVEVLDAIHRETAISTLRSHEETGVSWTYARDRAVQAWARNQGIAFVETAQHGVIRRLKSRNGWAKRWDQFMSLPVTAPPARIPNSPARSDAIPDPQALQLACDPCPQRQIGGRLEALKDLKSFLKVRGRDYRRAMSSPLSAEAACSRLSAHLAFGTLSMREAYQAALKARKAHREAGQGGFVKSIDSFVSRLHWHCHFIQKLEDETAIETEDLHPAYRDARPDPTPETLTR